MEAVESTERTLRQNYETLTTRRNLLLQENEQLQTEKDELRVRIESVGQVIQGRPNDPALAPNVQVVDLEEKISALEIEVKQLKEKRSKLVTSLKARLNMIKSALESPKEELVESVKPILKLMEETLNEKRRQEGDGGNGRGKRIKQEQQIIDLVSD